MLLVLNGLLLLGITFVPFPTAVLAEYVFTREGQAAAMVYSGTFFLIAIVFNVLWRYASSRLLSPQASPEEAAEVTRQYTFGSLFYAVAFVLVLVSPPASVATNLLVAIYFALPCRPRIPRKGRATGH